MGEVFKGWSGGEVLLKVYAGGQLGEEKDSLELGKFGGMDMNRVNLARLISFVPGTVVSSRRFLFGSAEHMRATVDGKPSGEVLCAFEQYGTSWLGLLRFGGVRFLQRRTSRPVADRPGGAEDMGSRLGPVCRRAGGESTAHEVGI